MKKYLEQIEKELIAPCDDIIQLLDDVLIPNSTEDTESNVFYLKMKGDYYRYLSEVSGEDTLPEVSKGALNAYEEACGIANEKLEATHPIRLGLALNYSVFHYEVMNDHSKACELAKKAFDDGLQKLDELQDDDYKDS